MRDEKMRDEMAQEIASTGLLRTKDPTYGSPLLEHLEEAWQEVHATEEPYDNLGYDYYTGLAEMVLRVANCQLDELVQRCGRHGLVPDANAIQAMKVVIPDGKEG